MTIKIMFSGGRLDSEQINAGLSISINGDFVKNLTLKIFYRKETDKYEYRVFESMSFRKGSIDIDTTETPDMINIEFEEKFLRYILLDAVFAFHQFIKDKEKQIEQYTNNLTNFAGIALHEFPCYRNSKEYRYSETYNSGCMVLNEKKLRDLLI